jgi:uncharacterized protein YjbJ (UPF0337 family)
MKDATMNGDQLEGETRDVTGKVKETAGNLAGDSRLQNDGLADQFIGKLQKLFGGVAGDGEPVSDRVRRFAKERPLASAALAGVVGLAVINSLRGKGRGRA